MGDPGVGPPQSNTFDDGTPMINVKTPKGLAGYMNITVPDTRFDPEGKYKANITLTAAEAENLWELFKEEAIKELGRKIGAKAKMPGKVNEDGSVTFTFKNKDKPNVYDSQANLLGPEMVAGLCMGGGSIIRVNGEATRLCARAQARPHDCRPVRR